jgi:hypothetical protein
VEFGYRYAPYALEAVKAPKMIDQENAQLIEKR